MLGVDGAEVVDGGLLGAFVSDFGDGIAGGALKAGDQGVDDVDEDNLVTGLVEELANEAALGEVLVSISRHFLNRHGGLPADVTTTKVNCLLARHFRSFLLC
jgi:hypothetical protein